MLERIRAALTPDGVFTGSEALGRSEGAPDHMHHFDDLEGIASILGIAFPHVRVRERAYPVPGGVVRREGYWRAALSSERLNSSWR